jgi:hypothetical protein
MKKINEEDLKKINGGTAGIGTVLAIAGTILFFFGIFEGYTNPGKCNK